MKRLGIRDSGFGIRFGIRAGLAVAFVLAVANAGFAQSPTSRPATTPDAGVPPAVTPRSASERAPAPRRPPRPGEVEVAPIKCWWKSDTTEVRVGQRFTVTLTCGVIETQSLKVVANTNSLDPGALQVTPFEVAAGVRRDDILSPPWRYFQYEYQVRLLSEGFFGQDVTLPGVPVTYNVQEASGGGAEGRDQTYNLPPLPMRVASLVPKSAADIRDVSDEGFDTIAMHRTRASTATVSGAILIGFSLVLIALALARAFGRFRLRRPVSAKPLAPVSIFGACVGALAQVKAAVTSDGWSPALARKALALVRIAAAVGIGRPVAQATASSAEREGQLQLRQGLVRRRRVVVSAATTAHAVQRALDENEPALKRSRPALEQFRNALQTFSTAGYGKAGELDTIALDRALSDSLDAARQLRMRSLLPFQNGGAADSTVTGLGSPSITGDRA